jgi:hypothetical protein
MLGTFVPDRLLTGSVGAVGAERLRGDNKSQEWEERSQLSSFQGIFCIDKAKKRLKRRINVEAVASKGAFGQVAAFKSMAKNSR